MAYDVKAQLEEYLHGALTKFELFLGGLIIIDISWLFVGLFQNNVIIFDAGKKLRTVQPKAQGLPQRARTCKSSTQKEPAGSTFSNVNYINRGILFDYER